MTKATPPPNDNKVKRIDFLKVIAANPDRKIPDIGKEFGMSQSSCYNAINEFVLNCIWTDEDKDYPAKVLAFYNKEVPNPDEQLNPTDIQQLRHFVDEYYEKHLPGGNMSKQAVHTDEVYVPQEVLQQPSPQFVPPEPQGQPYRHNYNNPSPEQYTRMAQPPNYGYPPPGQQPFNQQQYQRGDMSTDSGFLRNLLVTAKYVHPSIIDRFIQNYEMNKEIYDRDPMALLELMKHMFTSQQGEIMWKTFQRGRGKFVTDAQGNLHPNAQGQMDPMLMMLFSQMLSGGGNPQMMMPMMQQMGGGGGMPGMGQGMDPQSMMYMMMMSQMNQKSAKDQQKQDTNEMFEKLIQAIMLKMVGGSVEDKKPWDMYGMGMMGGPMGMMGPPQIQEVLDGNGRVTQRNIVPSFGLPGQQQGSHSDPLITAVLNNTMNTNTQLLMKLTDVGKTPTDILMSMIPYFKDSGNASLQLTNMVKTMNEIAPGFFQKGGAQQEGGIEIAKLKFDTELAMQAQRMELSKMEHTWRIDEMDRKANNDNAQNWMHMIENLGGTFTEKVAPALMEGIGKGSLLGKPGEKGQQPMDPMTMQMRMQQAQMRRAEQMRQEEKEEKMMQQEQQAQRAEFQQYAQAQQTEQQRAMMMIGQLQAALQQSEREKQFMANQLRDIQSVPTKAYQQGGPPQQINDTQLVRMQTGELQQMLQELGASTGYEQSLKSKIESILANRHLMDQHQPTQAMESPPQEDFTPKETENVSSEQTRDMEEHYDEPQS